MKLCKKRSLFVFSFIAVTLSTGFANTIMVQVNMGVDSFLFEDEISRVRSQELVNSYEDGLLDSLFERGYILFNAPGFTSLDISDRLLVHELGGAQEEMYDSMNIAQSGGARMLIYIDLMLGYDVELQIPLLDRVFYRVFDVGSETVLEYGSYEYTSDEWPLPLNPFEAGAYLITRVLDAQGVLFALLPGAAW
jgi:hypothetical protein